MNAFLPYRWVVIGLLAVALAAPAAQAEQFRNFNTIRTPAALPPGTVPVEQVEPIDPSLIEQAVRDLMAAWNSGGLERMLSNDFFNKSRLLDAIAEDVPRNATIRILGIQAVQTLSQLERPEGPGTTIVISTVSATVRTQVEFEDPSTGFNRLEGLADYIFDITMRVTRS
jgi:hypothetical protein